MRRSRDRKYVSLKSSECRTPRSSPRRRRERDGFAGLVAHAGCGHCLVEEGGVAALRGSRGIRRDDFESVDATCGASPSAAFVVDDDLVTIGIRVAPLGDGFGGLLCPCVHE